MWQKGFTLIELIVVIVILGILAAVALPKFIDLTSEALDATVQGVAGAVSSASAINYGAYQANSSKATRLNQANVCTTAIMGSILQGGSFPSGGGVTWSSLSSGDCSGVNAGGTVISCGIQAVKGGTTKSATASVICTG